MARKILGTKWGRKQLDDTNDNFEEIYKGEFLEDGALPGSVLEEGSVDTLIVKNGSITNDKMSADSVNSKNIVKGSVTTEKTNFFKESENLNLFDGNYETIYMTGSTADGYFTIRKGSVYRSAIISVKIGEKLHVKLASKGLLKIATISTDKPVIDSKTDGSILFNGNTNYFEVNPSGSDKLVIISVSNQSEEPYLEVTKNLEVDEETPILSYPDGVYTKDIENLVIDKRIKMLINQSKSNESLLWFPPNTSQESYFQFDKKKKSVYISRSLVFGKFIPWLDFRKNYRIPFSAEELLIPQDTYVTLVLNISKLMNSNFTNKEIKPSEVLEFVTTQKTGHLKQAKEVFGNNYIILGYYDNVANGFIPVNMPQKADYSSKMIIQTRKDRIFIFLPTASGKHLRVRFEKTEKTADNNKVWNLSEVHSGVYRHGAFEKDYWLIRPGEWEMALKLKGASDFIGGSAHGDEIADSMIMMLDGTKFDIEKSDGTQFIEFSEFKFMQRTKCFNPDKQDEQVAYHNVEHTINAEGMHITQRIEWLSDKVLDSSYLAMLPVLRKDNTNLNYQITDTAIDDLRYKEFDVKEPGFTTEIKDFTHGISNVKVFGKSSNFSADVTARFEPRLPNSAAFVQNNGDFNKIYFDFCGPDYEVKKDEVWKSESHFKLQLANN